MNKQLFFLIYCLFSSLFSVAQLAYTNDNSISSPKGQVLDFKEQQNLLSPRYAFGYEKDANYVYVSSGISTNNTPISTLERYDVKENKWEVISKKTPSLRFSTLALTEDKLFIIGGRYKTSKLHSNVDIYDIKSQKMMKGKAMPEPVYSCGSAVWGGKIYVFGGAFDESKFSKNLWSYDPIEKSWEQLPGMPEEKSTRGEIIDGKLYIIGGYNQEKASNSVDVYDISSKRWSHVFDLPVDVSGHATTVIDGKIWIVGNANENNFLASFDPINKIYIEYNSNIKANLYGGCAYVNNELIVFGGIVDKKSPALNNVQKLGM